LPDSFSAGVIDRRMVLPERPALPGVFVSAGRAGSRCETTLFGEISFYLGVFLFLIIINMLVFGKNR
jgi:hypothetical protein